MSCLSFKGLEKKVCEGFVGLSRFEVSDDMDDGFRWLVTKK